MRRWAWWTTFAVLAASLATACATPVGVDLANPREVQRELTESVLSSPDRFSAPTREFLTRMSLVQRWKDAPDETLLELHRGLAPTGDLDRLYALAELSFLRADQEKDRAHALAAALYAYAFLFGKNGNEARHELDPFDPRIQVARNLYNRGLTVGLEPPGQRLVVDLSSRRLALPFGTLDVTSSAPDFVWAGWSLTDFAPVADYRVRGLDNRYRKAGIGAPLAAHLGEEVHPTPEGALVAKRLRVPVTAFLRVDDVRAQLASGHVAGKLDLYSEDVRPDLVVDGDDVPIELEKSSSLAYMLEGAPVWDFGLMGFRLGDYLPGQAERLVLLHPHQPGRIPLVLVHGTFSSPATWAQMVNELENDPEISKRYEIWLFIYNSGNPIPYSAGLLAQTLKDVVQSLDPQGTDPALQRMVIVGHSQGGLLTKLMTVHSGDAFWNRIARKPIDQVDLDPDTRALLQRSMFYEPLPFVKRVIFLSTPHHGSYLSDFRVTSLISRLVQLPARITKLTYDLATKGSEEFYLTSLDRMPTSLDNMSSRNRALTTLAALPIAPGIRYNSIIAVSGDGPYEDGGDGVVKYQSAHIEGAESEKVVKSGHSVQMTQEGIQEVRRILIEHAEKAP